MEKKVVLRRNAPATDAPYSPAIIYGSLLFVSGQGPMDPKTKAIVSGSFEEELELTLQSLKNILEEAGSSMDKVLKVTVFLSRMEDYAKLNEIYKRYFIKDRPARTCIEASRLPFDMKVEIEAIAAI
ncbi:MAG: 2-iminobutanoate/2-iminopropanoate deaminase [Dehalococcoidia bacterium]|nr:2-iminobutanoate/2-iminopropanoate deaminase [Chloroflexota bacterium]MBT9160341.1 2-iminobutanoate/2-iminopropanoate deaminase [Chloroflexota bacterium]MBT9162244.1 2-iminobutanoate/2-iminopropanoate deaminase [Chloroflexota bacterium]